jgi:PKD repeat protein
LIEVSGTGPANFVLNQSDRRTGDPAFQRQASWYDQILNVQLSGNNYADKTTIYFAADPTDNWDDMYDAQKRQSNANQPTLYTRIANYPDMVGINGLPNNNSSVVSVPMGMIVGTAGTYTFTFEDISTFDASTLIYLEDLKTGTIQNLRVNEVYTFTSTLSDDTERFVIHFYPPAAIATVDGNCEGLDGAINVDLGVFNVGGSVLTWDSYELTDANGVVVATNTNVNGNISVTSLPAGNYNLNLSIQGYQTSEVVTIGAPDPVDANYNTGFSTAYTQAILEFLNQSVNATNFAWTFGDGTTSNLENPTHIYNAPGQYDVTLVASSGACSDTYSTKVEVLEVSVGLPSDIENPMVTITSYQDVITIGFLNLKDPAVQVDIFDLTGRKIIETLTLETGQAKHQIKMSYIPSGYYFVRVTGTDTYSDKKIFLTSDN